MEVKPLPAEPNIGEPQVKQLRSMRNPENPSQRFEVLEVWGDIYKGKYRMRFIYYSSPTVLRLIVAY